MDISEGQLKILKIIAEKSGRNPDTAVIVAAVIQESGLPADEVNTHLGQLQGLGLIKLAVKVSLTDFNVLNITKEGLDATLQK